MQEFYSIKLKLLEMTIDLIKIEQYSSRAITVLFTIDLIVPISRFSLYTFGNFTPASQSEINFADAKIWLD